MSTMYIKPKRLFSTSYVFSDKDTKIATIEFPLLSKIIGSNSATLIYENEKYELTDAVSAPLFGATTSTNTNVNTSIKQNGKVLVQLIYKALASNQNYSIIYPEKNLEYNIQLEGSGIFNIYFGNEKIGSLKNQEIILRRSHIELNQEVSPLVQFLVFWGSINTQNVL